MKRNLGKYSALMLFTLTAALVSGIASADCRLDDGTSKEGAYGPAELLPPCSEQAETTLDTRTSQANESGSGGSTTGCDDATLDTAASQAFLDEPR